MGLIPMQMPNLTPFADLLTANPGAPWDQSPCAIWTANLIATALLIIFLVRALLRRIPPELEDAARMDGCGFFRICGHIILPGLGPLAGVAAVAVLFAGWDDIVIDNMLRLNFGMIAAGITLLAGPLITLCYLVQRYIRTRRLTTASP